MVEPCIDVAKRALEYANQRRRAKYAIVWGPGKGGKAAGFRAVETYDVDKLQYAAAEPWRIVGYYTTEMPLEDVAEDVRFFYENTLKVVAP